MQNGEIYSATLKGAVHADEVELHAVMNVSGNQFPWTFQGKVTGDRMGGTVLLGEYGQATWSASRA